MVRQCRAGAVRTDSEAPSAFTNRSVVRTMRHKTARRCTSPSLNTQPTVPHRPLIHRILVRILSALRNLHLGHCQRHAGWKHLLPLYIYHAPAQLHMCSDN
ncbi:hypothetical protein C8Q77DRAFT_1079248 [Trametes polyzona]|nr:hypothetical protein C8Q77DRAFT_1079248 [Trametes polyzona]